MATTVTEATAATVRIKTESLRDLRIVAALTGERHPEVLERLLREEVKKVKKEM